MSGKAEQVYSTAQAAERVGVGAAMLRRYAQTLEALTGADVPHTRRDGRQFSAEHVALFQQARALINDNKGLSVEAALRAVIQGDAAAPVVPSIVSSPSSTLDTAALVNALRDAVTAPLVAELRELQAEVAALRLEAHERPTLPDDSGSSAKAGSVGNLPAPTDDGLLVKLARRLERVMRR